MEGNILITGAAGFIGFHLAERMSKMGFSVLGLDNINDYYDVRLKYERLKLLGVKYDKGHDYNSTIVSSNKYPNLKFIKCDLTDKARIFDLFSTFKFHTVINLAAQAGVRYSIENPDVYIQSNVVGFFNVLEASRVHGIKHLVFASSSSVYGLNKTQPFSVNDNVDRPVSLYAATKKSNELMAHSYSHLYNLPVTGLRFFTVYGPYGRPDMAYFSFVKNIAEGRPIRVFNHGLLERDFTYIDDIISGIQKAILTPPTRSNEQKEGTSSLYRIYNLGNNKPVKLIEFINCIEDALSKNAIMEFVEMQPGDVVSTWADIGSATADLGYQPLTTLNVGISKFVSWFQSYHRQEQV